MASSKEFQSTYNGGEQSKKARARIDLDKYRTGCRLVENMKVLPVGGATRRDGYISLKEVKDSTVKGLLVPYNTGLDSLFMLEFGDLYIRVYLNRVQQLQAGSVELITNGDFAADITSWTDLSTGTGEFVWDDLLQAAALRGLDLADVAYMEQSVVTVIGKIYSIAFDRIEAPNELFSVRVGTTSGGNEVGEIFLGSGSHVIQFVATAVATFIGYKQEGLTDNLGPNLVINGDFATDTSGWTDLSANGGSIASVGGALRLLGPTFPATATAKQLMTVANGPSYTFEFTVPSTGNFHLWQLGSTDGGSEYFNGAFSVGLNTLTFNSISSLVSVLFSEGALGVPLSQSVLDNVTLKQNNYGTFIDNVSVREASEPLEIVSPYLEADFGTLQYRQLDDRLLITSTKYKLRSLKPESAVVWNLTEEDWTKDDKIDGATGTNIGDMTAGGGLVAAFDGDTYKTAAQGAQGAAGAFTVTIGKDWGVGTPKVLKGVVIWSSTDNGFWETENPEIIFKVQGSDDDFAAQTVDLAEFLHIDDGSKLTKLEIFNLNDTKTPYESHRIQIQVKSDNAAQQLGVAEVEFFESIAQNPPGLNDAATTYAPAIGSFQERTVTGGQSGRPMTIYGSKVGDPLNLDLGKANDSDAYEYGLVGESSIQWFSDGNDLIIGTLHGIHRVTGNGAPVTPNNISADEEVSVGVAPTRPAKLGNAVLYIQADHKKIQEVIFNFNTGKLEPEDLNKLAEHFGTESPFVGVTEQESPDRILWAWREDGLMVGVTYNRKEQVTGWHRHPMINGDVETMASLPRSDGSGIDVYAIIRRTIEGVDKRTVEVMEEGIYSDGSVVYEGVPATTWTGFDHLEGQTVGAHAEGGYLGTFLVTGGQINFTEPHTSGHAGLEFIPKLIPNTPIRGKGELRSFADVIIELENTGSLWVNGRRQSFRKGKDPMGAAFPLFNGEKRVVVLGWSLQPEIIMEAREMQPLTILAYKGNMES